MKLLSKSYATAIALFTLLSINSAFIVLPHSKAELKYVGSTASAAVFQLTLNNIEKGEYIVAIKDSQEQILYSERVKGENISRRYKLTTEDVSVIEGYVFEVTNKKTNEKTVYKISSSVSVTQNVSIVVL